MGNSKDIRDAVEAELAFDPLVDATDISAGNINGDVTLTGSVPSYPQYREAVAAAQRVSGVTKVHNRLEVVLPYGYYRDDPVLTTAANNALALHVTVPEGDEATAHDGDLTLTGTVSYGAQREAAGLAAAGLIGVRNVKNKIEISRDADPADVTKLVQEALVRYGLIDVNDGASDVDVTTNGNAVTLTGHVRTWAEHDAVVNATWMASGVYDVEDDLLITG